MAGLTRRHVLVATAAVGVAGGAGGLAIRARWWDQRPSAQLRALSKVEYDLVQAIAEAWMPAGGGPPDISGAEANVGAFVDEMVAHMPDETRKLFKLGLHLLDDLPLATELRPYHALELHERTAYLESWLASPWHLLRQLVSAVLIFVAMGYTVHPEVAKEISPFFRCGYGA